MKKNKPTPELKLEKEIELRLRNILSDYQRLDNYTLEQAIFDCIPLFSIQCKFNLKDELMKYEIFHRNSPDNSETWIDSYIKTKEDETN